MRFNLEILLAANWLLSSRFNGITLSLIEVKVLEFFIYGFSLLIHIDKIVDAFIINFQIFHLTTSPNP